MLQLPPRKGFQSVPILYMFIFNRDCYIFKKLLKSCTSEYSLLNKLLNELQQITLAGSLDRNRVPNTTISIILCFPSKPVNVFNFFSISVGQFAADAWFMHIRPGQTFNYTLLKYGSLLNRSLAFVLNAALSKEN